MTRIRRCTGRTRLRDTVGRAPKPPIVAEEQQRLPARLRHRRQRVLRWSHTRRRIARIARVGGVPERAGTRTRGQGTAIQVHCSRIEHRSTARPRRGRQRQIIAPLHNRGRTAFYALPNFHRSSVHTTAKSRARRRTTSVIASIAKVLPKPLILTVGIDCQRIQIARERLHSQCPTKNRTVRAPRAVYSHWAVRRRQPRARLVGQPLPGLSIGRAVIAMRSESREKHPALRIPDHRGRQVRCLRGARRQRGLYRLAPVVHRGHVPGHTRIARVIKARYRSRTRRLHHRTLGRDGHRRHGQGRRRAAPGQPRRRQPRERVAPVRPVLRANHQRPCLAAVGGTQQPLAVIRIRRVVRIPRACQHDPGHAGLHGHGPDRQRSHGRRAFVGRKNRQRIGQRCKTHIPSRTRSVRALPDPSAGCA